jgi:hypothetical protein
MITSWGSKLCIGITGHIVFYIIAILSLSGPVLVTTGHQVTIGLSLQP